VNVLTGDMSERRLHNCLSVLRSVNSSPVPAREAIECLVYQKVTIVSRDRNMAVTTLFNFTTQLNADLNV